MFCQRDRTRSNRIGDSIDGCYGYSKENAMERRFRDAWGWGIAGGAPAVLENAIAAQLYPHRQFSQA
jgi:hypothetical protein